MNNSVEKVLEDLKADLQSAYNATTSAYRDALICKAMGRAETLLTLIRGRKC